MGLDIMDVSCSQLPVGVAEADGRTEFATRSVRHIDVHSPEKCHGIGYPIDDLVGTVDRAPSERHWRLKGQTPASIFLVPTRSVDSHNRVDHL